MLGPSSFSVLSQSVASSGYSESVDLEIVDEIIERAPRSATAFPLVYKAYVSTLQDNGLSPANDTAYYQFLLKLQVIRAGTWGEKWDLWRATNLISAPAFSGAKLHIRSPGRGDTSRLAEVRARVPFLAGASSDLDDAFGETSYSADGESVTESESPAVRVRPSPRKSFASRRHGRGDHSRSLVGYTPDQSVDFSSLGLDLLPARTSTPVDAPHRTVPAATPPPYSISESTASVSEQYDLTAEDTQLIEGSSTPKASAREWEEQRMLQEEAVREMERRADQFYQTGLVGRCFDVWAQANDWIQRTTRQIDTVRANILLRQCLQKWRDEHQRVLSLPNTADQHRQHYLQAQALQKWMRRHKSNDLSRREETYRMEREHVIQAKTWDRWRSELVRIRTYRWEKNMRAREKSLVREKDNRLQSDVLDRWRGEIRTRIDTRLALSFDAERLLSRAFVEWHYRLEQKERLEGQLSVFQRTRDRRLCAITIGTWVQRAELSKAEAKWTERADERLLRSMWEHWRLASTRIAQADSLLRRNTLKTALQRWITAKAKLSVLERKARIFRQVGEQALLRRSLTAWTVAEREVLLERVRDQRLQKDAMKSWKAKLARIRDMDNHAKTVIKARDRLRLVTAFTLWQNTLATHRSHTRQADAHYSEHCLSNALTHWRAGTAKIQRDRQTADKAHAFFLLRQVFGVWKAQLARRKQERFMEEKRIELVRRLFDHWRDETRRSIEGKQQADEFRQTCNQRLLGNALSHWTTRVIQLKSRQLDISEQRDTHLLQLSLSRWTSRSKRIADTRALADSFLIVKGEDRVRNALRIWREASVRKRKRREAEMVVARERRGRLLRQAWDRWREKVVERRLQPIEQEVAIRHEDAILFRVWDTWKARATLLPAITYDNRRVKKKAWASLRRAMDRGRMMRDFGGPRDRRLLEDVFAVWREMTHVKVVARAGRLRGRMRPTTLSVRPVAARRISTIGIDGELSYIRPRTAPLNTIRHVRSSSHNRHLRREPASPVPDDIDAESVYSEPAYSRLRSELGRQRHRGFSEEPDVRLIRKESIGRSELINALRGGMGGR